ncbi:hypothetical protein UT300012_22480 [Paraclostridium bifermentans]
MEKVFLIFDGGEYAKTFRVHCNVIGEEKTREVAKRILRDLNRTGDLPTIRYCELPYLEPGDIKYKEYEPYGLSKNAKNIVYPFSKVEEIEFHIETSISDMELKETNDMLERYVHFDHLTNCEYRKLREKIYLKLVDKSSMHDSEGNYIIDANCDCGTSKNTVIDNTGRPTIRLSLFGNMFK